MNLSDKKMPSDRSLKKGRTNAKHLLTQKAAESFPRFFIVPMTDEPVAYISAIFIERTIKNSVGKNYKAKRQRTGDLIEIETKDQDTKLLSMKYTGEFDVWGTPCPTLNYSKGVISKNELVQGTDEELEHLAEEKAIVSRRITIKKKDEKTKDVALALFNTTLHHSTHAAYLNCKVRLHALNSRRCFKCQLFGHCSLACRGKQGCHLRRG